MGIAEYLADLAIVGNSGSLLGAGHGAAIDAHRNVARFNQFVTAGHEPDVGSRLTVWVTSGSNCEGLPWTPPKPAIVAVAMPLHAPEYARRYSRNAVTLPLGVPVEEIPVDIYRRVARACPNPTSGVTFCAWVWSLLPGPLPAASLYGFSHFAANVPYHYYWTAERNANRPKSAHNGPREARLFATMVTMPYREWVK